MSTYYKDHLGNARLGFSDYNGDEAVDATEITQQQNYYPFGLEHKGNTYGIPVQTDHKYLYNGKELQEEMGLDWLDYGARNYDATVGRFLSVDPLSEWHMNYNPYHYCFNNPILYKDPFGTDTIVYLNTVEVYGEKKSSFIGRVLKKISNFLLNIPDYEGNGEEQNGGIHLTKSGDDVSPTKTTATYVDQMLNMDDLFPAIGGAGPGGIPRFSPLTPAKLLNKVGKIVGESNSEEQTSDKEIQEVSGDATNNKALKDDSVRVIIFGKWNNGWYGYRKVLVAPNDTVDIEGKLEGDYGENTGKQITK